MCSSSAETTVYMWHLLLVILDIWLSGMQGGINSTLHTRESSTQNNKYQVSYKYSCFSLWCAHSRPKHLEKRNKHTKKNCAPCWLYLKKKWEIWGFRSGDDGIFSSVGYNVLYNGYNIGENIKKKKTLLLPFSMYYNTMAAPFSVARYFNHIFRTVL
jgi:hypothetical protein